MRIIEMRDVSKKYGNGTTALRGVSVSVESGEFAYIVGPSGAGKSTFIKLLYREEKIDKGSVTVADFNLAKIKKKDVTLLSKEIITLLQAEDLNSRDIQNKTKNSPDEVIGVLQDLLENNTILVKPNNKYTLRS